MNEYNQKIVVQQAEKAILGKVLLDGKHDETSRSLDAEFFTDFYRKEIFKVTIELDGDGAEITPLAIFDKFKNCDGIQISVSDISNLLVGMPSLNSLEVPIQILKTHRHERLKRREVGELFDRIQNENFSAESLNDGAKILTKFASGKATGKALRTVKMSDVHAQSVEWLWKPFLAIGAFVIIEGAEGEGKTFITLAIATATASGKGFPMMSEAEQLEPANVVLMSAEDSLAHTIKPRLEAMNAPCERIVAIDEPFTLDRDGIFRLGMVLAEHEPALVIIDPLFSFTGKVNLDRDNEIRSVTSELIRLAGKYECVIVGVRHIGKSKGMGDPRNAGLNGIGWRASARSVLLVGKNPDDDRQKAIVQTKNNFAPICDKSIGYEIRDGEFFWTGESTLTAEKMLSLRQNEGERAEQSEAVAFLNEALNEGEREAKEIEKEADKFGITAKQLRTARNKLDVQWRREGFGKDSKIFLRMPPSIDAQNASETIIDAHEKEKGHLCVNDSDNTSSDNSLAIDALSLNNGQVCEEKQTVRASMQVCSDCGLELEIFNGEKFCSMGCGTSNNQTISA